MRLFKNKNATIVTSSYIYWMFYIVAVGVALIVITSLGNYYTTKSAEIPKGIEELILIQRFLNSDECFVHKDEHGIIDPIVSIDLNKFNKENMKICFPESDIKYAFSLSLESLEINLNSDPVNTFNWVQGFGSRELIEDVFILKDGIKYDAKLKIRIKNA